jgi:hypothetical protein
MIQVYYEIGYPPITGLLYLRKTEADTEFVWSSLVKPNGFRSLTEYPTVATLDLILLFEMNDD